MRNNWWLVLSLLAIGCGGSPSASAVDASVPVDAGPLSRCGHPGDTGNSLGVGQYCDNSDTTTCSHTSKAHLCSSLANGAMPSALDTYFCSLFCMGDGGADQCGENAVCMCDPRGCACLPTHCLTAYNDGGT